MAQVAICTLLLLCTGLFLRSLQTARGIDVGLSNRNLLLLAFDPGLDHRPRSAGSTAVAATSSKTRKPCQASSFGHVDDRRSADPHHRQLEFCRRGERLGSGEATHPHRHLHASLHCSSRRWGFPSWRATISASTRTPQGRSRSSTPRSRAPRFQDQPVDWPADRRRRQAAPDCGSGRDRQVAHHRRGATAEYLPADL